MEHAGGCLCGGLRYSTRANPLRVTICHCRFCQRATGSAYMVEPIFRCEDFSITGGIPAVFETTSEGSGKTVRVHFCSACGTKLYLSFERFPDAIGVYAGTFDDPNWFEIGPDNAKHIFVGVARHDTVFRPDITAFREHAITNAGEAEQPLIIVRQPRGSHPEMDAVADQVTPEFVDDFAAAFNRHDVEAILAMMTDDPVFEASAGTDVKGQVVVGREAVGRAFQDVFDTFPDAQWSNARHFIAGDRGVSEWVFSGTRKDGTRIEVQGCDVFTFRDGKIALKNSYRKQRF